MSNIAVLIPSHINYKGQTELLDKCIVSLLEQTVIPDIYISISFDNDYFKNDFKTNILRKYFKEPNIRFIISNEQKFQMEHLYILSNKIPYIKKYDLYMFSDDDDTYHSRRVDNFSYAFEKGKNNIDNFQGIRENINNDNKKSPEYWAYGIKPVVIERFFNYFDNEKLKLLKHKLADIYFRNYLWIINGNWICIREILYNYNINNPNSICGKIGNGNIFDNVILELMYSNNKTDFNNIIKKYNIDSKILIKHSKKIFNLCKLLYTYI